MPPKLRFWFPFLALTMVLPGARAETLPDELAWTYASEDDPGKDDIQTLRNPVAGTDGIYGESHGGYLRLPYDGSAPTIVSFGSGSYWLTSSQNSEPCVAIEDKFPAFAYVSCRTGPDKSSSDDTDPMILWWLSPHVSLIRKLSPDPKKIEDDDIEEILSLVSDGDHLYIITDRRLLSIWKGKKEWSEVPLKQRLDYFGSRHVSQVTDGDTLWYGEDKGEFGGKMLRIDLKSGEVHQFDGISNVTGMLKDRVMPHCVIISAGLSHLFISGGDLMRLCGDKQEKLYGGGMPIWGLFESKGLPYALMQTGVVPLKDDKFDYSLEQKFKDMGTLKLNDLPVTQFGDALFVYTDARGNDSTGGGGTPFAVTLPTGIKLNLTKTAAPKN